MMELTDEEYDNLLIFLEMFEDKIRASVDERFLVLYPLLKHLEVSKHDDHRM